MSDAAIEVHDLSVSYGDVLAVDDVSFTAPAGAITALLGPNGAGKTSTVEVMEGLRRPAGGQVRVLGLDPITDHAALTARMGVMLQEGGVYPAIRPREALRLFAGYYRTPADPDELLTRVGLERRASAKVRNLSGGEQQRLSLALALVGRPEIAFLDEPTAGVDVEGRRLIRGIVEELRGKGVTVVLTTHDLDEAEKLADHVVILDRGRVVAEGAPTQLMSAGEVAEIRFGAPTGIDLASLAAHLGGTVDAVTTAGEATEYLAHVAPTPAAVAALTAWLADRDLPLADLRAGRQRLEDVFLRLTTESTVAGPVARERAGGRSPAADPSPAAAAGRRRRSLTRSDHGDEGGR